ncbi:hypothetical protein [Caulobacter segnis]
MLQTVFASAATPQKCVFIMLTAALLLAPALAVLARRRALAELRLAGPLLGLLMGGMNSFHMARTIQRLPQDLSLKQVAPGVLEVSTLIVMGVLVGLVAQALLIVLDATKKAPDRSGASAFRRT